MLNDLLEEIKKKHQRKNLIYGDFKLNNCNLKYTFQILYDSDWEFAFEMWAVGGLKFFIL